MVRLRSCMGEAVSRHAWILKSARLRGRVQKASRRNLARAYLRDKACGQRNYTVVFRYGLLLFGTFECDGLERVYSVMKTSEIFRNGRSTLPS